MTPLDAANPLLDFSGLPRFGAIRAEHVTSAIEELLRRARADLRRWMARDGTGVRPAFREWHAILHRLRSREIAAFLCSETPLARRLRQSSPLAGLLSDAERRAIRRNHEKAGA